MANARSGGQGKGGGARGTTALRIEVAVQDVRSGEQPPPLVVYALTRTGRLLGQAEVKSGRAEVALPEKPAEPVRIVVGPRVEGKAPGEVAAALLRLNVAEASLNPGQESLQVAVARPQWLCWLRFCTVQGTLLKRTTTGGLNVDLPSCGAQVEIYEVDPIWIILPKIPPYILERLRELVRQPWPPGPPERLGGGVRFPPVGPGPGPDPGPLLGLAGRSIRQAAPVVSAAARQQVGALMAAARGGALQSATQAKDAKQAQIQYFNFPSGASAEVDPADAMASVGALAQVTEIRSAAAVSLNAFKASLLANPALLYPILCWIWPWGVTMQLITTVTTDDCGKFSATFLTGCSNDTPDLYFKAYRQIGFLRIPIYDPLPVACHTWWNYACGTPVTLITTSPFALGCPPCQPVIAPDHWVLDMAVGNTSIAAVTPDGFTSGGAPFGGYIRFRFAFDNTLLPDLNVKYYGVRWSRIGSGNPLVDSTEVVWRHYAHWVGSTLMIEPYKLGPQPVGGTPNLYEIDPASPPVGQWIIADAVVDTTSAAFPSTGLAPAGGGEGDYLFELTLYDSAGNAVDATAEGISFVVPTTTDLTSTIPTAPVGVPPALRNVSGGRLYYQLHVDNNPTHAAVQPPAIAGIGSADPCGLLRYDPGDTVTLQWTATQPYGYATYEHDVVKGATVLPAPISSSGAVGPAPGTHSDSPTVAALLGTCTIAGFAETVSVWATATDGWTRLSQYDSYAIQAFALAPTGA